MLKGVQSPSCGLCLTPVRQTFWNSSQPCPRPGTNPSSCLRQEAQCMQTHLTYSTGCGLKGRPLYWQLSTAQA